MERKSILVLLSCTLLVIGCQSRIELTSVSTNTPTIEQPVTLTSQIIEASCGQCQFGMEGKGCDLAVRFDGKSYYVDGAEIDDFGDAHGDDGMCNCIRQARVSGHVNNGRFVAESFELLPQQGKNGDIGDIQKQDRDEQSSEKDDGHGQADRGK